MKFSTNIRSFILVWVLTGLGFPYTFAQVLKAPNQYSVEIGSYAASAGVSPFWMRTNQYGIVPYNAPAGTLRGAIRADYDSTRKFAIGYGLNAVANMPQRLLSYENGLLLPEAYVNVKLGVFEAYAGRRREVFGLVDSTLSSGSYSWSGNAMPVPKVQVGLRRFTPIGFTRGWVSVMGMLAHGWLNETGFIRNAWLHQSALYVRLGKPTSLLQATAGFTHNAVWAGQAADPNGIPAVIQPGGQLPSSFQDYIDVVLGLARRKYITSQQTPFDQTNRVGNHLGTIDLGLEINLKRHSLFLYRQNIYEDGSLFYFDNIADGLNGLRIRRNNPRAFIQNMLFEYLNTTSQGGQVFLNQLRGRDDYFNNAQYRDGWAYRHHTIGTPFITPALGPNGEYPYGFFTDNNRVQVFHLGMNGALSRHHDLFKRPITYQLKASVSDNLGTYTVPFPKPKPQFSGYLGINWPLNTLGGMQLITNLAIDNGEMYANNIGGYVGFRKVW